jgi:hypothetical protein
VVVVVVVVAGISARGATVTSPSPKTANSWGPCTASVASNMASASRSVTVAVAAAPAGGGVTRKSPWSKSTGLANRALTTAVMDGAPGDAGVFDPVTPHAARTPAQARAAVARTIAAQGTTQSGLWRRR